MDCLHCHADTTNGLALCDLCRRKVTLDLEFLPIYYRNLARWKPGRAGSRPVPGSRIPVGALGSGMGEDKVIRALDEVTNALTTWARALTGDRDLPRPLTLLDAALTGDLAEEVADHDRVAYWLCLAFEERLTSIATLEWAGEFVREMGAHERILRELTEQIAPGWYAGACRRMVKVEDDEVRCGEPTFVVRGLTWVSCRACGSTTYAKDHLPVIIDEARAWVGTPRKIAEALVALLEDETDVERLWERIRRWGRPESAITSKETGEVVRVIPAGPLHAYSVRRLDGDGDEVGPRYFRLGDVLDQLQRESRALVRAG